MNRQVHARLGTPCASRAEQCDSELTLRTWFNVPQRLTTVIKALCRTRGTKFYPKGGIHPQGQTLFVTIQAGRRATFWFLHPIADPFWVRIDADLLPRFDKTQSVRSVGLPGKAGTLTAVLSINPLKQRVWSHGAVNQTKHDTFNVSHKESHITNRRGFSQISWRRTRVSDR